LSYPSYDIFVFRNVAPLDESSGGLIPKKEMLWSAFEIETASMKAPQKGERK
jgi:hypothetical protein